MKGIPSLTIIVFAFIVDNTITIRSHFYTHLNKPTT